MFPFRGLRAILASDPWLQRCVSSWGPVVQIKVKRDGKGKRHGISILNNAAGFSPESIKLPNPSNAENRESEAGIIPITKPEPEIQYYNVLQCNAEQYHSVLQCNAEQYYSVLQCKAEQYYSVLQCSAVTGMRGEGSLNQGYSKWTDRGKGKERKRFRTGMDPAPHPAQMEEQNFIPILRPSAANTTQLTHTLVP